VAAEVLVTWVHPALAFAYGVKALFDHFGAHKNAKWVKARTFDPQKKIDRWNAKQQTTQRGSAPQQGPPIYDPDTGIMTGRAKPYNPWDVLREFDKLSKEHQGRPMNRAERDASAANRAQRQVLLQKGAADEAKVKGQTKEAAQRSKQDKWERKWNRTGGTVGTYSRGSPSYANNPLRDALLQTWLSRQLDSDAARKRLAHATNRRGALATRPLQSRSATNRRGALAQRPVPRASVRSGVAARPQSGQSGQQPNTNSRTVASESPESKAAHRTMEGSRSLPQQAAQQRQGNSLLQTFAQMGAPSLFQSSPRLATASGSVPRVPTRTVSSPASGRNSFATSNSSLAGTSQSSKECRCPKPKKTQKSKKDRCTNPIVSKTIRDGFITTKRKIQCLPFKPNAL